MGRALPEQARGDPVNDAVRELLAEDQEDLAACDDRVAEPEISYQDLLDELRVAHRKQVCRNR